MRIIICDRCGAKIYQTRGTVGYVALGAQDIQTGDVSDDNPFENWDFCDDCMRAINAFVGSNEQKPQPNEQKPQPNEQKPQKKKPFPGSGPSIDVKKAQALRDAGWSVAKIAAELKTTVYKWTHAPEPKKPKPHEWAEHEPYIGPGAKTMLDGKYREGAEDEQDAER